MTRRFDLAVIGGGINGCGIAADASGRGLKVILIERDDLASGTSSASSKLIHGGLRYLEHYAFSLVAHALAEREILLANAPHVISTLRFVVPHVPLMRSRLMMRAGLWLYDHLAPRKRIPASGTIDLTRDPAGLPLKKSLSHGFSYWDCWVDDARLVVLVARAAADRGCAVHTRTSLVSAQSDQDGWRLSLRQNGAAAPFEISASALVNAAGPWAARLGQMAIHRGNAPSSVPMRLVKGSHVVVPRIEGASDAYLLQAPDGRVVFLLPFEEVFTLIGTTDVAFEGDPADASASKEEIAYLIDVANRFLAKPLELADIVWSFAGVRPLYDDRAGNPSAVTRDYRLELDAPSHGPPLLTVAGGKVTTYRRLAEEAIDRLSPHLGRPLGPRWTAQATLPGGDLPGADRGAFEQAFLSRHPQFSRQLVHDLVRRYGTLAEGIAGDALCDDDLGRDLGGGLREREVSYLVKNEWARTAEDVLWRRTKAGLFASASDHERLSIQIASIRATSALQ